MISHALLFTAYCQAGDPLRIVDADAPRPHIISILQDDLGYYDSGTNSPLAATWTKNITQLTKEGITLTNHYTHWHCSPTRRSFLTGRLPIHHGEQLSGDDTDDIDLRMTWVSQKLKVAGYNTHWFGKWHTGFKSYNHLGMSRGFDESVGSFQTGGPYSGPKHSMRWQNDHPIYADKYFNNKPAGCNSFSSAAAELWHNDRAIATATVTATATCDASTWLNNTKMQCGDGYKFVDTKSAAECCAACTAETQCTHWVHTGAKQQQQQQQQTNKENCHLKSGENTCGDLQKGYTAGRVAPKPTPPTPPTPPIPSPTPVPAGGAVCTNEYSTDLYGQEAVQAVRNFDASNTSARLYIHLCFQAVHAPYDVAPGDPTGNVYRGMLWRADVFIGEMVTLLKSKGMYDNTLIVYSADNGGVMDGINYPLRGEKHSNWEGGMRVAAFVSGGFLPSALRGTSNGVNMHIVDWHPTFAFLAGVDTTDDPPVKPLATDITNPDQNIYGEKSYPPLDGVNVWPMLADPSAHAIDSAHAHLVLSKEVLVAGKWKLLVSQPHFKTQNNGWKDQKGVWRKPNASESVSCMGQDADPKVSFLPVPAKGGPCLFDVRADPGEHTNLAAANPGVVETLWAALNQTILTQRDCNGWSYIGRKNGGIPGPKQPDGSTSCSPPELLGHCDRECAFAKWKKFGASDGPKCGVPGCEKATNATASGSE